MTYYGGSDRSTVTITPVSAPPRPARLPLRLLPFSAHHTLLNEPPTRIRHEYVSRTLLTSETPSHASSLSGHYAENPFASTHSLDANPFDDPTTASQSSSKVDVTRLEELERRERDLERRETELAQKADHIRKHGRNNWPPCTSPLHRIAALLRPAERPPPL